MLEKSKSKFKEFKEYIRALMPIPVNELMVHASDPFLIKESLNSSFKIIKTGSIRGADVYYIDVNSKEYRIFIEKSQYDDQELHIGFERLYAGTWNINITTNDLTAKELLGIFGTIKKIVLNYKFISIHVETGNTRKYNLYKKILLKLSKELSSEMDINLGLSISPDDSSMELNIMTKNNRYIPRDKPKPKFRYTKK